MMQSYSDFKKRISVIMRLQSNHPRRINVIASAARGKLKEIAHSMILVDLLGNSEILRDFLDTFVPNCNHGKYDYDVQREFRHMDICLKNDLNFIIIENKVNGAIEQKSQIFRYVSEALKEQKRVYVLYLNPVSRTLPSDFSLNTLDGSVFNLMSSEDLIVMSYAYDIVPWLESLLANINQNQEYLRTSIFQYVDYLKIKFGLETMQTQEVMNEIDSMLGINKSCSFDKKIDVYNEEIKKANSYINEIEKIMTYESKKRAKKWREALYDCWGQDIDIEDNKYDDRIGYVITLPNNIKFVFTTTNGKPWWGIRIDDDKLRIQIKDAIGKLFPEITTEKSTWDFWCYTSFSKMCEDIQIIHEELKNCANFIEKDKT